ncbi:ead/Ea22-like family protein [Escherichia coli]|uniref:ead/Ea22-like family protein n=1 Tax=Escherichia coli TaxID=562 RepID=UPI002CBDDA47|nr:ead/Ea22-like family protein [Escherichia coli]MEB3530063.1 ead/Ea22-like family protein [Escherichia coli]
MSNIDKQALRGQSVEGSYYLAECGHCGEMYPSNKLDGGESLFSGDYGECFCHLCGADDSDIADNGAWGSEAVTAWNYQQKRIEALLDELEKMQAQSSKWCEAFHKAVSVGARYEERIAELEAKLDSADKLQDSAFRHGLQHGFSLGQTDNQAGFEECLSAYGTGKGE